MKKIIVSIVLLAAGLTLLSAAGLAQTTSKATGHWQGRIEIPDHALEITVDLAQTTAGEWSGSMSIMGATAVDVPLNNIVVEDTALRFTANLPGATSFVAQLTPDATGIAGKASNSQGGVPFQLSRKGEANVKTPPPSTAMTKEFEGAWEGTIEANGKSMRVGLKLAHSADGAATATIVAIDQGNLEIPATTVIIKEKQLQLEARSVSGTYQGTLSVTGEITGKWTQGPARLPLTFKRAASGASKL